MASRTFKFAKAKEIVRIDQNSGEISTKSAKGKQNTKEN